LWNEQVDFIQSIPVVRDSDPVEGLDIPSAIQVLHGFPKEFFSRGIFKREQYGIALKDLESESLRTNHGVVIITGHPGIGMSEFFVCR
jgi:hypothetical protein